MARDAIGFLERVVRENGPIVRIPFGTGGMVLLAHPDDVKHVLLDANRNYIRGNSIDMIRPMLGNGLPMSDPPFWLRQRRIMQPSFSRQRVGTMVDTMNRVAKRHLDRLRDGEKLRAHDLMLYIARDAIVETMFSDQLGSDLAALDDALLEIEKYVVSHMLLPVRIPLWLPLPDNRRFQRAIATLERVVYGLIAKREAGGVRPGDLLDALMDGRDPESGETMSRRELRDEVMNIFFAGHETTANALTWVAHMLSAHPAIAQRVRGEVDGVLEGREPRMEDVARLEYTSAVVRETLRLYPPAWMFVRLAADDDVIRGYRIPKGTAVMLSPYVMHRQRAFWPEPERFDPDRFVRDPSLGMGAGKNWSYMPFGGGPHVCIGNHFAMTEAVVVVALLSQRGSLHVLHPSRVRPRPAATLKVADDLPVRFVARNAPR
jgi:cytochrome P450